ncbi:TRAP transporter small permease [Virgibacillus sp. NKC19-3]|uniref:TRAP transporter small permease subunit n=1 Tax=Virgibacillus saliphilus TaxID=2831674 RepID=UPI001C9B2BE0|nr:TRAP transporter small permease [Virgibacillus sp. NKC19-3]MBY7142565.1 TRAP transporter small permease [Virgibacillus sp. NKC19-3]
MDPNNQKNPLIIRIINGVSEVSGYISAFSILISAIIITITVLLRYLFDYTTVWQMELTIYFLMFATFVGGAYGLKHDAHVGVDVITEKLPVKMKSMLRIITSLGALLVTVILVIQGWSMWYEALELGWRSSSAWGPPLSVSYFILPLGMTFISLQFLVIIYEEIVVLFKKEKS